MKPRDQSSPSALTTTLGEVCFTIVFLVVVTALLTGIGWGLFQAVRGLVWTVGVAASYIGAIGWIIAVPLVALAIYETVSRFKPNAAAASTSGEPGANAAKPSRGRTRGLLCAGSAAVIMSGNLCLNIAASRIDAHYQNRQQQGVDIYKNHDLAKLVGQCIRLAILRHAKDLPRGDDRAALEAVAAIAPAKWSAMTNTKDGKKADPLVLSLADAKLTEFIQNERAPALHKDTWASLLTDWRTEAKATALTDATLQAAAETIAEDFGITLREALKADFEKGGKAWAAMQLDIAQQLLNRTPVSMATGNEQITAALAEVKSMLAEEAKGLPALHRTIIDARQAQDQHARAVTRNFDHVIGSLERIEYKLGEVAIGVNTTNKKLDVTLQKLDAQQHVISDIPSHLRLIVSMISDRTGPDARSRELGDSGTHMPHPDDIWAALVLLEYSVQNIDFTDNELGEVIRFIKNFANNVDFHANWGGLDGCGVLSDTPITFATSRAMPVHLVLDHVLSSARRSTALGPSTWGLRGGGVVIDCDIPKHMTYLYIVEYIENSSSPRFAIALCAHADSLLNNKNQTSQSAKFFLKMSLNICARVPAVFDAEIDSLYEALFSGFFRLGETDDIRDVVRKWLELRERRFGPEHEMIAESLSMLADFEDHTTQVALLNRALEMRIRLAGPISSPVAESYFSLGFAYYSLGQWSKAIEYFQKSLDIRLSLAPLGDWNSVSYFCLLIRAHLAVEARAEALASFKQAFALSKGLKIENEDAAFSLRKLAGLGEAVDDLPAGAELYTRLINWNTLRAEFSEAHLAGDYADRAEIRHDLGDVSGAEEDVNRSIGWALSQGPSEDRNRAQARAALALLTQASVRNSKDPDALAEAEQYINMSIEWGESQDPPDERSLGTWYAWRALIREDRGDHKAAASDHVRSQKFRGDPLREVREIPKSGVSVAQRVSFSESDLAKWYTVRARIRQSHGDLGRAAQDISKAIAWLEKHTPTRGPWASEYFECCVIRACILRDSDRCTEGLVDAEHSLEWARSLEHPYFSLIALWSGDRATILAEMNRLREAVADIAACIAWHRQHQPDNQRVIARFLRDQARILAQAGDWAKAAAAIAESLPLHEAVFGNDHVWTKKARAWHATIAKKEVPPRWIDTEP